MPSPKACCSSFPPPRSAGEAARSPGGGQQSSAYSGSSVTGKVEGPVRVRWGWGWLLAFLVKVLGREKSFLRADPDTCVPDSLLTPPVSSAKWGWARSVQGWPRAWGWPSAGEGQAGRRRPGRPQFLPQVLVSLAAGKGELISQLHPKQRQLLEPAEGSSASWGLVLPGSAPDLFFDQGQAVRASCLLTRLFLGGIHRDLCWEPGSRPLSTWQDSKPVSSACVYSSDSLCARVSAENRSQPLKERGLWVSSRDQKAERSWGAGTPLHRNQETV